MNTILVVTDLCLPSKDVAVRRAAHLASARAATLKLMHMPDAAAPPPGDVKALLALAARQLERDHPSLRAIPVAGSAGTLDDLAREAARCELVVLPERRERSLRTWLLGQPVQRLLRACDRPVLLARTEPRPHYARILIGVDFSERSRALLAYAAALDPQASLELFHAIDRHGEAYLKAAEVSEHAINAYRASRLQGAQDRILRLTDSFGPRRNRVQTALGRGDAGRQLVVQQEHSGADLVVVGADRWSALVPLLASGVAHQVLTQGRSDVLVVPRNHVPSSRSAAARRLTSDDSPHQEQRHAFTQQA